MSLSRVLGTLLVTTVALTATVGAQGAAGASLGEAAVFSLYVQRHANTIQLADLAATRGTDGQIRKTAETIARAHREAKEKLERSAVERHLTLAPPARDTSTALLARATGALEGKTGRAFDSTWVSVANDWFSTLILDNNRNVSARVADPGLRAMAQAHTTWLFRQSVEVDKLRKKFR